MCRTFVTAGTSRSADAPALSERTMARRSRSIPAPVSAEMATPVQIDVLRPRKIRLVDRDDARAPGGRVEHPAIVRRQRHAAVHDGEHEIRDTLRRPAARHPLPFHDVHGAIAQSGRVDQRHGKALDLDALRHEIPRRAGHVGDDGAIGAGEAVEQARLAGVRAPEDRHLCALANEAAARGVGEQRADLPGEALAAPRPRPTGSRSDSPRRRSPSTPRAAPTGRAAAASSDAMRAVSVPSSWSNAARACSGVTASTRSRTASACTRSSAVEVRAEGELARLGQPGAQGHGSLHDRAQQDLAAMHADLHDVVARCRSGGRKRREDDLVRMQARRRGSRAKVGAARHERLAKAAERGAMRRASGPLTRTTPRPPRPWRRRDRHDRVVALEHDW
jgi:hypothetical protein